MGHDPLKLSVAEALACWRPPLAHQLGAAAAQDILEAVRPLLTRAVAAEQAGTIYDFQPSMANCNTTESLNAGWFYLQLRYRPVVDGVRQDPVIKTLTLMQPESADDQANRPPPREAP